MMKSHDWLKLNINTINSACRAVIMSSWSIFRFFFRHLQSNSSHSLYTPLSTFFSWITQDINENNNELLWLSLLMNPPPLFIQDGTIQWALLWHPHRINPSANPLWTPWVPLDCYHHAHHQSSCTQRPNSLHETHPHIRRQIDWQNKPSPVSPCPWLQPLFPSPCLCWDQPMTQWESDPSAAIRGLEQE